MASPIAWLVRWIPRSGRSLGDIEDSTWRTPLQQRLIDHHPLRDSKLSKLCRRKSSWLPLSIRPESRLLIRCHRPCHRRVRRHSDTHFGGRFLLPTCIRGYPQRSGGGRLCRIVVQRRRTGKRFRIQRRCPIPGFVGYRRRRHSAFGG